MKDGRRFRPPTAPKASSHDTPRIRRELPCPGPPETHCGHKALALVRTPARASKEGDEKTATRPVSRLPQPASLEFPIWRHVKPLAGGTIHTAFFAKRHWRCHTITGPDNTQGWGSHRPQEPRATDFYRSSRTQGLVILSFCQRPHQKEPGGKGVSTLRSTRRAGPMPEIKAPQGKIAEGED